MANPRELPLIGFAGISGAGKTTLLEKLLKEWARQGFAVATVKHAHHQFDIDHPEKDSFRHRKAGAREVIVSSAKRCAHIIEHDEEPSLWQLLAKIDTAEFVIVEGFKREIFPKIEIYRPEIGKELLAENDENIIAIASPAAQIAVMRKSVKRLDLDDPQAIAEFIINYLKFSKKPIAE